MSRRIIESSNVLTIKHFNSTKFDLLATDLRIDTAALRELDDAERRLGMRLPPSVREWYSYERAIPILAEHSNEDPPIPVSDFSVIETTAGRLIPFRRENQGVCTWAILLDGSDDPPVFVEVDSGGTDWQPLALDFSTHVFTCVWDYRVVLGRPMLVKAQNGPISPHALECLAGWFGEQPRTFGWPGSVQYRFGGGRRGVLIWSADGQSADWFVGAADGPSLESALRQVWRLDDVGRSFYEGSDIAGEVLGRLVDAR